MAYDYIDELNRAYDDFFLKSSRTAPVLTIEAGELDFVRFSDDLRSIENRIRESLLLAPYQPELPLSDSNTSVPVPEQPFTGVSPTH